MGTLVKQTALITGGGSGAVSVNTFLTNTQAAEGWYRVATSTIANNSKGVFFRIKGITLAGTSTEANIQINIVYRSGNYSNQKSSITANTSHSCNIDSNTENGFVIKYVRVSFDSANSYIDVYISKTTAVTIETAPLIANNWSWATGNLVVNPVVGSYGSVQCLLYGGLSSNNIQSTVAAPVVLSVNSIATEPALSATSTSTARTTNSSLLSAVSSGANASASITIRGVLSNVSNTGTTNTNIAYYATASGGSKNNYSFYGAAGKIYNADTTASSSITTGSVIIAGGIGCAGEIWASAVHGAVWNDIADFILVEDDVEIKFGCVYCFDGKRHKLASKYAENGIVGIASDTFGFSVGKKENSKQIPIAIGGFVLAHCDKVYPSGTPLTTGKGTKLVKASVITKIFNPEKIVATFYKVENSILWNKVSVNGRHWVKVR